MTEVTINSEETLQAAEDRYQTVVSEVQSIQNQLGDRNRQTANGERAASKEYWAWKTKASTAMRFLLEEQRMLKSAIKAYNRQSLRSEIYPTVDPKDALSLIAHSHKLFRKLAAEGVELDLTEQALIDSLRWYVADHAHKEK